MKPDFFPDRGTAALVARCALVSCACLMATGAAPAQSRLAARAAMPAASAASAPRISPYVLAARRQAQEAASAPIKVNPLMQHRLRAPRATGCG
jgi:hypothetical protein